WQLGRGYVWGGAGAGVSSSAEQLSCTATTNPAESQSSARPGNGTPADPRFQIALNSYPVLGRRTPQSRSPAQGQETELRILAGIGDRMVEGDAGYREGFPSTLSRQVRPWDETERSSLQRRLSQEITTR